ncbi:MAG: hypothetical protein AAGD96_22830 [Chloroflexota bacterium]
MDKVTTYSAHSLMTKGAFNLLVDADLELIHQLVGQMAPSLPLLVVDCACAFNANRVQEIIHLAHVAFAPAMEQITITRPFTAYQFNTAISHLLYDSLTQQQLVVVIFPLHLLHDENITAREAMRLLKLFMRNTVWLKRRVPLVVAVRNRPDDGQGKGVLFQTLMQAADRVMTFTEPSEQRSVQQSLL